MELFSELGTHRSQAGWPDPPSGSVFAEQENVDEERRHPDRAFTPQMMINGQQQTLRWDCTHPLHTVRKEEQPSKLIIHIISATTRGDMLDVEFSVSGSLAERGADVFAVLADDTASLIAPHGRDSDPTLSHVSIARTITRVGTLQTESEKPFLIPLSAAVLLPPSRGRHLILFAQAPGFGRMLGLDTKPL